jgi:hypothetical protein
MEADIAAMCRISVMHRREIEYPAIFVAAFDFEVSRSNAFPNTFIVLDRP